MKNNIYGASCCFILFYSYGFLRMMMIVRTHFVPPDMIYMVMGAVGGDAWSPRMPEDLPVLELWYHMLKSQMPSHVALSGSK